jgi:ketosteroid isomerase-like protein
MQRASSTSIVLFVCTVMWSLNVFAASPNDEITAPVVKFIDSFNKGDVKAAAATHTEKGIVIIDEVAPYLWQGHDSFKNWLADLEKHDKARGITDGKVTLGSVTRVEVEGDRAYVVYPSAYTFKQKGVAMKEAAQMTFAMKKAESGWRINGWSFTGPTPTPGQ